jgi:hypothetical protein
MANVSGAYKSARASTLNVNPDRELERAKGIEPLYAAWKTAVLPLNYARVALNQFF